MVREAGIPALPLDGKLAAKMIRAQVKEKVGAVSAKMGRPPGLGIVMANGCVLVRDRDSHYFDARDRSVSATALKTRADTLVT